MTYIQPLCAVVLAVVIAGGFRALKFQRADVLIAGVAAFAALCWPPVDWLLSRPLEIWYPVATPPDQPAAEAIVVLSAGVAPPVYERPYALPDFETFQRCEFAARLYSHWRVPVLLSGGSVRGSEAFSRSMRVLLLRAGVPETMIWTEERSRTTHENARFSAIILRLHGIKRVALVVEAQSMLRAAACFRKEHLQVVPEPCAFRELGSIPDEILPVWKAIARNETTFHESLGLGYYWFRGWI